MIAASSLTAYALLLTVLLSVAIACSQHDGRDSKTQTELPEIDLAGMDERVVSQLTALRKVAAVAAASTQSDAEIALAWGALGEAYHAYELTDGARVAYQNAADLAQDPTQWWYLLAQVEVSVEQHDEAAAILRGALTATPENSILLRSLAEVEHNRGELEESRRLAMRLVEMDPSDASAWLVLAETEVELGNSEAAADAYEKCLSLQPTATKLRVPLANLLRQLGRNDEATALVARPGETPLTRRDPWLERVAARRIGYQAAMSRGQSLFQQGDYAAAIEAFEEANTDRPDSFDAKMSLGASLLRNGDVNRAAEVLEKAVEMDSENATGWLNYGSALMVSGRRDEAVEAFEQAIRIRPDYWLAHRQLAELLCNLERWDEAMRHFEEFLEANPHDERVRAVGGVCLANSGEYSAALAWTRQSLEILPSSVTLAGFTARLLAASPDASVRDGENALLLATELAAKVPSAYHQEALAMALAETGDFEGAARLAQEALATVAPIDSDLARDLRQQIVSYKQGQPWRDPGDRLVFLQ